jgi:aryl-alcohol dehydrogenase-like predicted oxidoreductase
VICLCPHPCGFLIGTQRGLSRKYIFDAVDASIERLGTYIDVLQIHRLDPDVPPEEIMEALNDVVRSGKVRYIGASSMWAHEFATLQFIAEKRGWAQFISMQNFYNLLYREEVSYLQNLNHSKTTENNIFRTGARDDSILCVLLFFGEVQSR